MILGLVISLLVLLVWCCFCLLIVVVWLSGRFTFDFVCLLGDVVLLLCGVVLLLPLCVCNYCYLGLFVLVFCCLIIVVLVVTSC